MEWASGNIYMRPRDMQRGETVPGHSHRFDHTHIVISGWFLARGWVNGKEIVHQKAAPEYTRLRELLQKYEPKSILRPIRFPDILLDDGTSEFVVEFINPDAQVPNGGTEIFYKPTGYHCLITANTRHDFIALDAGTGVCTYSHHTPQGEITQVYTGWEEGNL